MKRARDQTYRKQNVDNIHQAEYHVGHIVEAVDVSRAEQRTGDDVVRQHLIVILALLLHMNDEDLLQQES